MFQSQILVVCLTFLDHVPLQLLLSALWARRSLRAKRLAGHNINRKSYRYTHLIFGIKSLMLPDHHKGTLLRSVFSCSELSLKQMELTEAMSSAVFLRASSRCAACTTRARWQSAASSRPCFSAQDSIRPSLFFSLNPHLRGRLRNIGDLVI